MTMEAPTDQFPPPLIEYATPAPIRRASMMEIVFACFTLATGVAYALAAIGLLWLVARIAWYDDVAILFPACLFGGTLITVFGTVALGTIRASWRVIRGMPMQYRQPDGSSRSPSSTGTIVLMVAVVQLVVGSVTLAMSIMYAMQNVRSPNQFDLMGTCAASLMLVFTGVLLLRLKIDW